MIDLIALCTILKRIEKWFEGGQLVLDLTALTFGGVRFLVAHIAALRTWRLWRCGRVKQSMQYGPCAIAQPHRSTTRGWLQSKRELLFTISLWPTGYRPNMYAVDCQLDAYLHSSAWNELANSKSLSDLLEYPIADHVQTVTSMFVRDSLSPPRDSPCGSLRGVSPVSCGARALTKIVTITRISRNSWPPTQQPQAPPTNNE